ncbi:hypothetical protein C4097_06820 [Clostridioides difficile]|uniref:hypothetical protein n=1 Tax=Clostridioides sp. ZZV15-6598 TaxID=2811501 RepID=UPI001D1175C1|nr:hypothetical protein [Clostridioides sp. ZZV15-6598]MDB3084272.1 hypothetical protein [Clostridioides difficile]
MKKLALLSLLIVTITGCSKTADEEYKYATINTSMENSSIISLYDSDGNYKGDKKINYGGITLAGFKKIGDDTNENIYYIAPVTNSSVNDFVLQINKNSLNPKTIVSSKGNNPTFFVSDKKNIYSGSSSLDEISLSKTNLASNQVLKSTILKDLGIGIVLVENNEKLYLISFKEISSNYKLVLSVLNKENLNVEKSIDISDGSYVTGAKIINNNLYILKERDGNDALSNKMIRINLNDYSSKVIELPFDNLSQIFTDKNYLYITENNSLGETTKHRIARLDIDSLEINQYDTKNEHISSYINKDEFLSSDGKKIYIYNLSDFRLKKSIKLKEYENKTFVSFFINN